MSRHYALISVKGISEDKFRNYLADFINTMNNENKPDFGATVTGLDPEKGRSIESIPQENAKKKPTNDCELCMVDKATTTVDYQDAIWSVCESCKVLAESE